jgi:predicted nucleic acid-binding protein
MLCLDTDFLIALLRGDPEAVRKAEELDSSKETRGTTPINMFELYLGAYLSKKPAENLREVRALLSSLVHLAYDEEAARLAGELGGKLRSAGKPLGVRDLMIAAIAMRHGCTLLTRDEHFLKFKGLSTERW